MSLTEPCPCGALDCPSCGRLQGTYDDYHTKCGSCTEIMADCECEEPEPYDPKEDEEPEERDDYEPDDYERGIGY